MNPFQRPNGVVGQQFRRYFRRAQRQTIQTGIFKPAQPAQQIGNQMAKKNRPLQDQTKSFAKFQQALKPVDKKAQNNLPRKKGK